MSLSDTIATVSNTVTNFRNASGGSANVGSDANQMTSNGIYYRWYESGSNFPDKGGGYLYVARHNSNAGYCSQIFIREDGVMFNRSNVNGTWTAWQKLITDYKKVTDITSQVTMKSSFVINNASAYTHNGAEYVYVSFHNSTGGIPRNNRYQAFVLPEQYQGKELAIISCIGNTANNFNGYTLAVNIPGFYSTQNRIFTIDTHYGIYQSQTTEVNAIAFTFAVLN